MRYSVRGMEDLLIKVPSVTLSLDWFGGLLELASDGVVGR
jgi:hypothetical protein